MRDGSLQLLLYRLHSGSQEHVCTVFSTPFEIILNTVLTSHKETLLELDNYFTPLPQMALPSLITDVLHSILVT
jgi:hypothetical protein